MAWKHLIWIQIRMMQPSVLSPDSCCYGIPSIPLEFCGTCALLCGRLSVVVPICKSIKSRVHLVSSLVGNMTISHKSSCETIVEKGRDLLLLLGNPGHFREQLDLKGLTGSAHTSFGTLKLWQQAIGWCVSAPFFFCYYP